MSQESRQNLGNTPSRSNQLPSSVLPIVTAASIRQVESLKMPHEELANRYIKGDSPIAQWFHKRQIELYPDIADRAHSTDIALELMAIYDQQLTVEALSSRLLIPFDTPTPSSRTT